MSRPATPSPHPYQEREERFRADAQRLGSRARRLSNLRLVPFLALAAAAFWPAPPGGWLTPARATAVLVALAAFLALVVWHNRVEAAAARESELAEINREARNRVLRLWDELPIPEAPPNEDHPYAEDLDVFGRASLFQLLGGACTQPGRSTLSRWLLQPAQPATISRRQEAVRELAPELEFRQELRVRGRLGPQAGAERLSEFFDWAESEPWLSKRPAVVWASRLLPLALLALIGANAVGLLGYTAWGLALVLNLAFAGLHRSKLERILHSAFARERTLSGFGPVLALIEERDFEAPCLVTLQTGLRQGGEGARQAMERLEAAHHLAEHGHGMVGLVLQPLLLWDFRVALRLERWQREAGDHVRAWFAALGELDALVSLAGLAYDHPSWAFPRLVERPVIDAVQLGHPLLADQERVANDVRVGPPGTFLLVTGSNMSGKSTLLRSIGVNTILAQAGGPVCAEGMSLPPVRLQTTMYVHDSLAAGLSHFMAELMRLKAVVSAAEAAASGGPILLYLLDDVLHGTNTAERQIAVRGIIAHLLEERAIGAVTSHDLELADTPELADACRAVHFREQLIGTEEGPKMEFDYRLRPGVATSRNALALLRTVGLDIGSLKHETDSSRP